MKGGLFTKRFTCALLALCLLSALLAAPADSASDIIFVAVNDTIPFSLSEASMPFYSGGVLYLPHTLFNASALGVAPTYNTIDRTLTLSTTDRRLFFDLSAGTVQEDNSTPKSVTTLMRYGLVFLPANYCMSYFGISVSYLTSLGGYAVVRLKTGAEIYSDALFIEKAENLIAYRVEQFLPDVQEPTPETPDEPDQPIGPDEPVTPPDKPDEPDEPDEPEDQEPQRYYVAICGLSATLLDALDAADLDVTLLVTPAQIAAEPDLVRRAYGSGYTLGLDLTGAEDPVAALCEGNRLLGRTLCSGTLLVLADADALQPLQDSGVRALTAPEEGADSPLLILQAASAAAQLQQLLSEQAQLLPLRESSSLA